MKISLPNLIVFFRTALGFVIIIFFCVNSFVLNITGLGLLVFIAFLDWFDGHIARKLKISSKTGGLIDTLGDRITENTFLIFFAYKQLIPLFVPLVFAARSFISDFIRFQAYQNNIDTFSINKSRLGFILVASKTSRAAYLSVKIIIFLLGGIILSLENNSINIGASINLRQIMCSGSVFLVALNLLRFVFLVYDSKALLRKVLISDE